MINFRVAKRNDKQKLTRLDRTFRSPTLRLLFLGHPIISAVLRSHQSDAHFFAFSRGSSKPTALLSLPGLFKKVNSRLNGSDGAF
jgi:hypothetical protein